MVRVSRVSQVDYAAGKIKVTLPERDGAVSGWIGLQSRDYNPPKVGDLVAVDMDDLLGGVEVGGCFSAETVPDPAGPNLCYKKFGEDLILLYDKGSKTLEITSSAKIRIISAEIELAGSVKIIGDLEASGTIRAPAVIEGG